MAVRFRGQCFKKLDMWPDCLLTNYNTFSRDFFDIFTFFIATFRHNGHFYKGLLQQAQHFLLQSSKIDTKNIVASLKGH